MSKKLLLLFAVLILLVGCQKKPASDHRVWYQNKDEAINNGLISEGVTKEDLLGIEEDQGDTLIFYQQDLKLGVASLSKNAQGLSWYRSSPYVSLLTHNQPYASISFDTSSENKHVRKVVTGIVYDKSVKKINLFVKGYLIESKPVNNVSNLFYFLIRDTTADVTSIEVNTSE